MKKLTIVAVVVALLGFVASSLYAKPEFSKKEGKPCTHCHVKAGQKDLNDAGKEYQKTLKK